MRSIFGDSAADPEIGSAAERLRTVEQWRFYLAEYGADVLRVSGERELFNVGDEQRATGWLGYEGADEQRIVALEERLGTRLPPSYRSFLGASDGWSRLGPFMHEIRTTGALDWLDDDDAEMYMGTCDDEPDDASKHVRAPVLLIADEGDAQWWLLDSGDVSQDGEWAAYTWSSWQPGLSDRYGSFAELVAAQRDSFQGLKGHEYYAKWEADGTTQQVHDLLRDKTRRFHGRRAEPTAAVVDAQSVKTSANVAETSQGIDAGKKIKGRKRHLITDTLGLVLSPQTFRINNIHTLATSGLGSTCVIFVSGQLHSSTTRV
ncbi:hypothetical protein GCM10022384_70470 [Streptomyces marokkonensis]|uniref:Knr4/Smi1-like domain-containing protein n=1 Tax=Streptomyces marokkonensis TaxID=324855 RepID=A0ABP7SYA1_9ACTN